MPDITTILADAEPFNWNGLVTLLTLLVGAWVAWRVEQRAKTAKEEGETLKTVAETVDRVEKNSNGLNEQIVRAEKVISKAEGRADAHAEVAERTEVAKAAVAAERAEVAERGEIQVQKTQEAAPPTEVVVVNEPHDPVPTTATKPPK